MELSFGETRCNDSGWAAIPLSPVLSQSWMLKLLLYLGRMSTGKPEFEPGKSKREVCFCNVVLLNFPVLLRARTSLNELGELTLSF
jgi:hypothetical protein